jgi:hypothetical protein
MYVTNTLSDKPKIVTLKEYNEIQIEWMMVHKWYRSEHAGFDVGFNEAAKSWVSSGLAKKFREKYILISAKKN